MFTAPFGAAAMTAIHDRTMPVGRRAHDELCGSNVFVFVFLLHLAPLRGVRADLVDILGREPQGCHKINTEARRRPE